MLGCVLLFIRFTNPFPVADDISSFINRVQLALKFHYRVAPFVQRFFKPVKAFREKDEDTPCSFSIANNTLWHILLWIHTRDLSSAKAKCPKPVPVKYINLLI